MSTPASPQAFRALVRVIVGLAMVAFFLAPAAPAGAAALRTFANTYAQTLHGDIAAIGNANTTCNPAWTPAGSCDTNSQTINNSTKGVGIQNDVDTDPTTTNSSSSTVTIPAGSTIQYARLTWGTTGDNTDGNGEQNVKLDTPTAGYNYQTVTDADGCDGANSTNANRGVGCSADVTSLVTAGGAGTYTVANIEHRPSGDPAAVDDWSGWALYIVFSNPSQPLRRIVLSDGFQKVATATPTATVALSGFTAPAAGTVTAHLDYAVGEGDANITGDNASLGSTTLDTRSTPDLMNSTIAGLDYASSRTPSFLNNFGFDFHNSDVTNAIPNGATTANFNFTTTGDTYYPFSTGITIDLAEPNVVLTKTLTDVNGGVVEAGDVLQYQIVAQNAGNDGATQVVVTDQIPTHATYVPGSLKITAGANAGNQTDATGDDEGDYNAGTGLVSFRLGTGATSSAGGLLAANTGTSTVTFDVVLDSNLGEGISVTNTANGSYQGQTSLASYSNPSTIAATPVRRADMVVSQNTGTLTAGVQSNIALTASNVGGATTHGDLVTVTTSVPANVAFGAIVSATGWTCDTSSLPSITCTRSDSLNPSTAYPDIVYSVTPNQTAPSAAFSASVAGGHETDTTNDTDSTTATFTRSADLRVTNVADVSSANVGDTITYTVNGKNFGPSTTTGVATSTTLPATLQPISATLGASPCTIAGQVITCTTGALDISGAAASTATITIKAKVLVGGANSTINMTAHIAGSDPDPTPVNNDALAAVTINPASDVQVTETSSPAAVNAGSNDTFTISVKNNGPNTATGVSLSDDLPPSVYLISATPSQGSCGAGDPFTCSLGSIASGNTVTVAVVVQPWVSASGTTLSNPVTVSSTTFDQNAANNSATASFNVNPSANLGTTVTVNPSSSNVGDTVDYLVTVANGGPQTAAGSAVAITLPAGATVVSVTPSAGTTCAASGSPRTCTIGSLPFGSSATVAVKVTMTNANANSTATLSATASTTTFDPVPADDSDSADSVVGPSADLKLTETAAPASVNPGSNATYTFTVKNNGPNSAPSTTLTDNLPSGIVVQSITPSQGVCTSGSTFTCNLGTLLSTDSATVTVVVTPNLASAGSTLANPGSVASSAYDPSTADNSATASFNVNNAADVSTTVTATPTSTTPGGTVDYLVTVTNGGPSAAAGASVLVDLPNGATIVSVTPSAGTTCPASGDPRTCTIGTLSNGASATVAVKVTMTAANAGTTASVAATASATTFDPNSANNADTAGATVAAAADLELTETASPATLDPGSNATYVFTVKNNGPGTATGVSLSDDLPAGVTVVSRTPSQGTCATGDPFTCSLGTIANGNTATVTVVVTPNVSTASSTLANPGTVTSTSYDPATGDNAATASVNVNDAADLRTVVTATPASAPVGATVDYLVTVHNDGLQSATGTSVSVDLPAGATIVSVTPSQGTCGSGDPAICTLGTIANGAAPTIAVKVTLTAANAASNVTVSATANSATYDPAPGNNSDSASVASGTIADLALTETESPSSVDPASNATFVFTVTNNGPNPAGSVSLTDDLPAGVTVVSITPSQGTCGTGDPFTCSLGSIANAGTATVTVVVKPTAGAANSTLANPGTVTSGTPDPDTSNNAATASVNVNGAADLRTTVSASPTTGKVGDTIDYLVTVHNDGGQTATGTAVDLNLPNGATIVSVTPSQGTCPSTGDPRTCTLGTIANGAAPTIAVKITLAGPNAGTSASLSAAATSATYDPNTTNNTDSASVAVDQPADLKLTETVSPPTADPGSPITYTFTIKNNGPGTATGINLTDDLPPGATVVSITPSQGTCGTGDPFSCTLNSLPNGGSATVVVVIKAPVAAAGTSYGNPGTVSSSSYDPTPADNADSAAVAVNPAADLAVAGSVDVPNSTVGQTINYLLTVTNNGPSVATNAALLVHLPAGATIVSVTPSQGTCDSANPRNCTLGTIGVNNSATVGVQLTVTAANSGAAVTVSGDATATEYDPVTSNNTGSASSTTGDAADLAITNTVDKTTANVGDTITWTITASNNGPKDALATTVGDSIPAGVTITSVTTTGGTCTTTSTITCNLGTVPNGGNVVITVKGKVQSSAASSPVATTANVTGSVFDPNTANNAASSTATNVGAAANLRLVKLIDKASPKLGDHVTWTLQIFNDGPSAAANVHLIDAVPAGAPIDSVVASAGACTQGGSGNQTVDCVIPSIAGNSSATITIHATVTAPAVSLNNTASVTSSTFDPDTTDNSSTANSTSGGAADLTITLTPDRTEITVGQKITWNGLVTNNGPQTATGTVVTLTLPEGLSDVQATTPGGSCTIVGRTVTCTVANVPNGGTIPLTISGIPTKTNAGADLTTTAVVTANETDPAPADNTTGAHIVTVAPAVDLVLTKTADKAEATVGEPLTITSDILNRGPSTATDVIVVDTIPDGVELKSVTPSQGSCTIVGQTVTCSLGTLKNGERATITTVVVVNTAGSGQRLLSGGSVSSAQLDLDTSDNAAESSAVSISPIAAPAPAPFIDFTKTVDKAAPAAGDTVVYTITATNRGNDVATNVRVIDQLPVGLKYVGTKVTGGTCTRAATTISCVTSNLKVGSSLIVKVSAIVQTAGNVIANTATVTATGLPTKPAGSQLATASLKAHGGPYIFAAVHSLEEYSRPGKSVRIAVKITNLGVGTATGNRACFRLPSTVVLERLPAGISQKGSQFCISAPSLASGKYKRIVLPARVIGPAGNHKPTIKATSTNAPAHAAGYVIRIRGIRPTRGAGVTG